jgi:threonine dehydratase
MQGLVPELEGKTVVIPLCGGNVDTPLLGRVLERGYVYKYYSLLYPFIYLFFT